MTLKYKTRYIQKGNLYKSYTTNYKQLFSTPPQVGGYKLYASDLEHIN